MKALLAASAAGIYPVRITLRCAIVFACAPANIACREYFLVAGVLNGQDDSRTGRRLGRRVASLRRHVAVHLNGNVCLHAARGGLLRRVFTAAYKCMTVQAILYLPNQCI